ncbi:hypothetical protein [Winogradskyella pulchriflava]|uniref:Outer membrane protein beta-barrel domain-containing protein n=1 Tax=Winogradskyella pulchriflava TaxID=1110688 RepID=A0ABV6Q538_9FLAO
MNDKKNIDRLFQEKFKDFEIAPNDAVWNRISENLPKKKKKRRVIALWWQVGGVAAVIALLLTVGTSIFNSNGDTPNEPTIVNTEEKENNSEEKKSLPINKQNELKNDVKSQNLELVDSDNNDETILKDKEHKTLQKKDKLTSTSSSDSKSNAVVNNSNQKENKPSSKNSNNLTTVIDKDKTTKVAATNTKNSENNNKTTVVDDNEVKSVIKKTIKNQETAVTENPQSEASENSNTENTDATTNEANEKANAITEDPKKESIENAIAAQENIDEKEKEDEQNRWSIAPNVAPVYFSSLGQGSSIGNQFNKNSKSGDINMSYGITGTYALSKKIRIRAGVNRVNLSQTTNDVLTFTGNELASRGAVSQMSNINVKSGYNNVALMSTNIFDGNAPEIFNTKIAGDIDQRFGFIEVPLELEYRLLDKKFGVNVIGGFSTFFLNKNEIYADIDGSSTLIGEASNINSTSFSANFGLGLDYSLSKQWNINLEPQFKYQINTFNNTSGDYRPFFIGVYTGLSFKF